MILRSRTVRWTALLLVAMALATACGGGSTPKPIPEVAKAKATRDVVNNAPGVTSTIRVAFDQAFELAKTNVPLASLFEIEAPDPYTAQSTKKRILVQTAEIDKDSPRTILLHIKELIPTGSTLKVAKKGFRKGEPGDLTADIESDLSPAETLLASKALSITDTRLIDGSRVRAPGDADRDPAAMRAALIAHLRIRGATDATRQRALDRFDAMPADIVPSAKARAALAALTGTYAEGAIDSLLTANNCTGKPAALIAFQPPPDAPELFARVTFTRDGRRIVSLNPSIEGDRIDHIAPILAHEAIHCDASSGKFEEIAATAMDTFLYITFATANPEIIDDGTPLTKDQNVDAVAMINSGRAVPESIGILPSPGVRRAVPGTTSQVQSFADLVAAAYSGLANETPAEPLAQAYVTVLARAAGMQTGQAFNLLYLDELLARSLTTQAIIAAIGAFRLNPES